MKSDNKSSTSETEGELIKDPQFKIIEVFHMI